MDPAPTSVQADAPRAEPDPLAVLSDNARAFGALHPREKAELVRAILPRLVAVAPELAAGAGGHPRAWLDGPVRAVGSARELAESLADIAALGRPALAVRDLGKRPDGRLVARLAPRSWVLRAAQRGRETLVIFAPGTEPEDVIGHQAPAHRAADVPADVALVLASADDPSAGICDALHALFVQNRATLLVPSLARPEVIRVIDSALAPLLERGYLRAILASDAERAALAADPRVGALSYAGDAAGLAAVTRGARDEAAFGKPVSALLAGAGPVIVVPCLYALDELDYLARSIASQIADDEPAAPRVILLADRWPQRDLFLDTLAARLPSGRPPELEIDLAASSPIDGKAREIGVVRLHASEPEELLAVATDFANARLGGSLAAQIVAHPIHEDDPEIFAAIERAVFALRFGAVGINEWPARLRWEAAAPWGAYPGATLAAPKSGLGFRGDTRMLPRVEKAVIRGALRSSRVPAYFRDDPAASLAARRLVQFQAAPRARDLWSLLGR